MNPSPYLSHTVKNDNIKHFPSSSYRSSIYQTHSLVALKSDVRVTKSKASGCLHRGSEGCPERCLGPQTGAAAPAPREAAADQAWQIGCQLLGWLTGSLSLAHFPILDLQKFSEMPSSISIKSLFCLNQSILLSITVIHGLIDRVRPL